jgi:hypothetical protein
MPLTKVSAGVIAANAVQESVGSQSITGDKLGLTAINANNIVGGSITGAKLAANTVSGDVIGQNAISSNNIVSVSGSTITANTVANSAFQTGSVENYMTAQGLDFGMRNRIINGTMIVDQRANTVGANTVISSNAPYTVDRWRAQISQHNGTMNVRQDSTSTAGFTKSLRAIVTAANTSLPVTSVTRVWTNIEGLNVADLGFGTANAKPVTLSFFVRSSNTGTFSGALTNYDENRSYPFEYTINTVDTFEKKTITIPGDTSGNWSSNTEGSFALNFSLGTGTTNLGTANAWTGSWKVGTTGSFSLAGVLNATWYLTGVQLEEGSVPTSFEYRQFGTELALCQRYYYKFINNNGTGTAWAGQATTSLSTTRSIGIPIILPVPARTTPSFASSNLRLVPAAFNTTFTVTAASVYSGYSTYGTAFAIDMTTSGISSGTVYFVYLPDAGYVEYSMDL